MGYNILASVTTTVSNVVGALIRTVTLTLAEMLTLRGLRFNQSFDILFANGETKYFLYQLPANATVTVGLQNRIFKSRDGAAEIEILWNSTGFTPGTTNKVFNEYNKYDGNEQFQVSEITPPTVEGLIRETDFLTSSGAGNNTSGDVSTELGFRLYEPGTFFIAKVTNLEAKVNRILLGYSWIESPEDTVSLL